MDIEDEDGYIGNISFPLLNKFNVLTKGMRINCIVFSNTRNFETLCSSINFLNKDIPLQEKNCWGAPNWVDSSYESTTSAFEEIAQGVSNW